MGPLTSNVFSQLRTFACSGMKRGNSRSRSSTRARSIGKENLESLSQSIECDKIENCRTASKASQSSKSSNASATARIFVKGPSGNAVPVDVNLTWAIVQVVAHLITVFSLEGANSVVLKFRNKVLPPGRSLKECGAELGSVLSLYCDPTSCFKDSAEAPLPHAVGLSIRAGRIPSSDTDGQVSNL